MPPDKPPSDESPGTQDTRGEFIIIAILAVFVVFAIIGMTVIDYYGTQATADPMRAPSAAGR